MYKTQTINPDRNSNLHSFDPDYIPSPRWERAKQLGLNDVLKKENRRTEKVLMNKNPFCDVSVENHTTLPNGTDIFPLFRPRNEYREHIMLNEAMNEGVTIKELENPGSSRPDLCSNSRIRLYNQSGLPVFCLPGTVLLGGKQNRIVVEPFIADSYSNHGVENFHCVEPSRMKYGHMKEKFKPSSCLPVSAVRNRWFKNNTQQLGSTYSRQHTSFRPGNIASEWRFLKTNKKFLDSFHEISQILGQENCCGYVKKYKKKLLGVEVFQHTEDFKAVHMHFSHALAAEYDKKYVEETSESPFSYIEHTLKNVDFDIYTKIYHASKWGRGKQYEAEDIADRPKIIRSMSTRSTTNNFGGFVFRDELIYLSMD